MGDVDLAMGVERCCRVCIPSHDHIEYQNQYQRLHADGSIRYMLNLKERDGNRESANQSKVRHTTPHTLTGNVCHRALPYRVASQVEEVGIRALVVSSLVVVVGAAK